MTQTYEVGLAPALALEPLTATARMIGDTLEVYAGCQAPGLARAAAARGAGLAEDRVTVFQTFAGGGYGRKLELMAIEQAAYLARQMSRPVQLTWSRIQEMAPTRAAADKLYEERLAQAAKGDANDALWAIEAIMDYNPEPDLDKIRAKVLLINAEEDEANPPELGTVERAMKRVRNGRYVLIPAGPKTHGHFTHFYAEVWKPYLIEFMQTLDPLEAAAE